MRPSDPYDNLHTALGFYENNYTARATQERILSNHFYSLSTFRNRTIPVFLISKGRSSRPKVFC